MAPGFLDHWRIETRELTRHQTEILKGLGILLIVLHNVFHNLTPYIGQNEFSFDPKVYQRFIQTLTENPLELIRAVFSYWGHYGVQLFVFLSAYGLTRKYQNEVLSLADFFKRRVGKVYLSFLLCVVVYILLGLIKEFVIPGEKVLYWDSILWKVLLISNFIPGQSLMPVGPWWFIPFIFQFYLFYPLLLALYRKWGIGFLLVASFVSVLAKLYLNPVLIPQGININFSILGHLPVFSLGIYLAHRNRIVFRPDVILLMLIVFVGANYSVYFWVFADLAATLLMLAGAIAVFNSSFTWKTLGSVLAFYGGISFHLFMVNGFLRSPFHQFAEQYNTWWIDNMAALASLAFSTAFAFGLRALDQRLRIYFARLPVSTG